ncbi:hypothetical protein V8E36_007044 [Tilletia maclaganii]
MPVHAASWALSSLVTVSSLVRIAIGIVLLAVIRQSAHGIDPNRILDRLIAESQAEDEADEAEDERLAQKGGNGLAQSQEEQLRRLNAGLLRRRDRKGGKPRLAPVRDLHGRVFLLASGGLDTPVGLQLADALVRRGAQLILLDPRPLSHPAVLQLVHLLRSSQPAHGDGDGNGDAATPDESQLVYAEQCDLADLRSIDSFVKKWEALLQPGSRRDGPGSEPLFDPRSAKSDGVDASSLQAMSSPARRLDSVIFLPSRSPYSLTCKRSSVRYPAQENKASSHNTADAVNDDLEVETGHALALGRLHLILSLVPSLTTLPRERDIRIVNAVGPWYAAATAITSRIKPATTETKGDASIPAGFTNRELDWKSSSSGPLARSLHFSPWSPHLPTALTDLTWLGLSTYLQRRLDVLAGELTGTVMHSAAVNAAEISSDRKSRSNIRILTVSLGFERSQLLATFLPPPSLFEESLPMLHIPWLLLRALVWLALQPLALLLLRSPTHAAHEVLWAIRAPIRSGMELLPSPETRIEGDADEGPISIAGKLRKAEAVVPGRLHFQGDVVQAPLPPSMAGEEALRALYRQEEGRARDILARAQPRPTK